MKYLIILGLFLFSLFVNAPAFALVCRHYQGHEICILNIKRSAKKYWEYRASVSIDGVKTPMEVYNCRAKFKLNQDGTVSQFIPHSPGEMICSYFKK
ncbi:hypothetical protein B6N60_05147 [Richelia sinica FACHB-800]|uniref:Uncharacterized protein n=1 Tax=Richelia sinica FACHB-800 TaxID=1357546 RepID=A0A975Y7J6_9NOST|nr:hypothetical protein [Richelia sinica]MBD2663868.1 hypothetical protein [Richelia sinica FACHB-800]QXE26415.1 hypothetical protein B6N60_05147 [Richelia sinica FACHB-800]